MLVNIGFGNLINEKKIVCVVSPDAAPVKRMVQMAKDEQRAVDATCGRKTRAVLVMDNGQIVLSALMPDTIRIRVDAVYTNEARSHMGRNGEE